MPIFKVLHVIAMFGAVLFLVGEALLYARAIWRGDVAGLATVRRLVGGRPVAGAIFFLGGIAFGVLAALAGQLDLLAGWLLVAYGLVVTLFVINGSPWVQRLPKLGAAALEADAGRREPGPVLAAMRESRAPVAIAAGLNAAVFALIIADMILKPF